jgi:hypothetical protein
MPINSRAKGARGERAFRDELREAGYLKSFRTQQYCGTAGDSDVTAPELPEIHFEVKFTEKGNPYIWVSQAEANAKPNQFRVVAHRRKQERWIAIMPMSDFLEILRRSDLPK